MGAFFLTHLSLPQQSVSSFLSEQFLMIKQYGLVAQGGALSWISSSDPPPFFLLHLLRNSLQSVMLAGFAPAPAQGNSQEKVISLSFLLIRKDKSLKRRREREGRRRGEEETEREAALAADEN